MNTEKLKEAVEFFKIEGIMKYGDGNMKIALSLLIDLAKRYLACEGVMPSKKKEVYLCCQSAIDDCQLALIKKLDGLEDILLKTGMPRMYIGEVEVAIREHLTK